MTDNTNEDKEVERISQIAIMNGLLARAMRAEAERDAAVVELQVQIDGANALERECDRLRATLRKIIGITTGPTLHATDMAERMHGLAHAALKEADHD